MLKNIVLAFIPVFIAVDAIGVLPIFLGLTQGLKKREKRQIIVQSVGTALALAIGFIFLGKAVFNLLGISEGDFMIAGGTVLFCIAIMDLLRPGKQRRLPFQELAAVPIGIPLIVGPAVLTTSLILIDQYGLVPALLAVITNVSLAGVMFLYSEPLMRVLGRAGSRALSKIMALLLAAIAVRMIRKGIFFIVGNYYLLNHS